MIFPRLLRHLATTQDDMSVIFIFLLKCQYNKSVTKCKYIRYNVKDYSVVYNNDVRPVIYVRVCILLTYGKHLYDRIISLRGRVAQ